MKYLFIAIFIFSTFGLAYPQEQQDNLQTQQAISNNKIRIKLFYDSRNSESTSFVNEVAKKSNVKFHGNIEIYLIDIFKDEVAAKDVNKMLEEILNGKKPKDFNADVVCFFEDGTYIIGSENINRMFQHIVLSKLYPDLVRPAGEENSNNTEAGNDGLMKSQNYQGAASFDSKPTKNINIQKAELETDKIYQDRYQLLLNILISLISVIFGLFLGYLFFKTSKKDKVHNS